MLEYDRSALRELAPASDPMYRDAGLRELRRLARGLRAEDGGEAWRLPRLEAEIRRRERAGAGS